MAIRLPLTTVLDTTQTDQGTGSTAGGWAYNFKLPPDCDNVVVKFEPSIVAGGASCTFQTSDDGGTTFYDVSRTSVASNSGATAATGMNAQWLTIPVVGALPRSMPIASAIATTSLVATFQNGACAASTLGVGQNSGLPILGIQNRVFVQTVGNATAVSARVRVLVNSQSRNA